MTVWNDPLLGHLIGGRYRIERQIGQGGAGAVYAARQVGLDREVAIKTLRPELAADATLLERFRREARAAASLDSPHIVQVLDWADPSATEPAFIALELVRGESLLELMRREGRLAWPRAIAIVTQILSALATAHRAGIVHRDLKPGNVMVTAVHGLGESVKLLDFGIAQIKEGDAYRRLTQTGVILGTPRYMSPEQLRGAPLDARTDLWAAGVVLHRALTGAFPFDGPPDRVVLAVLGDPPAEIAGTLGLPPALVAITRRALAKSPDDRWPSASAMLEALLAVSPQTSVAAPTVSATVVHAPADASTRIGAPLTFVAPAVAAEASPPLPSAPPLALAPPTAPPSRAIGPLLVVGAALTALSIVALTLVLVALFAGFEQLVGGLVESSPPVAVGPPPVGAPALGAAGGAAPVTVPTTGDYPPEGDFQTYLPLAEAAIRARDPAAVLEAAYANEIDEVGRVHLSGHGSIAFTYRLSVGGCTTIMFPTPTEPPPASCLGGSPLVIPEVAPIVGDARTTCPALGETTMGLMMALAPYPSGGHSVSLNTRTGRPSYVGHLSPDGRVQPFSPYTPTCYP